MRKICIFFCLLLILTISAYGSLGGYPAATPVGGASEYLRIHIRAHSNEDSAQAVKYLVRDELVEYLTPIVADCADKDQALLQVEKRLHALSDLASEVLARNGFSYGAVATLQTETFPTRVYGDYTLPAGEYSALIVELGSGSGDNWWCVVYPPLCFTTAYGKNGIIYKSKILEILQKWRSASGT